MDTKKAAKQERVKLFKVPASAAKCADLLYDIRESRYMLQREVDKFAGQEKLLSDTIIAKLPADDASGITGAVAHAEVTEKVVPVVEDWDAFYKHVKKTGEFELMQRRLGETAIKERWDAGKAIPGVGRMRVKKVSVTKKKAR